MTSAQREIVFEVSASEDGERLDKALAAGAGISRGEARRALASGGVWLDGKRCKVASRIVRAGQRVRVFLTGEATEAPPPLDVLYEDDWILAVDKAAGVPSQGTRATDQGTLPHAVATYLGLPLSRIATVHRLDRPTSGVVVFGKHAQATSALSAAFREGKVERHYLAVVSGRLEGQGLVDAPLAKAPGGRRQQIRADGVPARTEWEALRSLDGHATLVHLRPQTGRTHQLRVHMAHLGHPILGDSLYGGPRSAGPITVSRLMLHAWKLRLPHPDGCREFVAPLPEGFPTLEK